MILVVLTLGLLALVFFLLLFLRGQPRYFRRPLHPQPEAHGYTLKKPAWVKAEVIWLKACMPHEGCRTVAAAFNARHQKTRASVGKTYVADTIKRSSLQIQIKRNEMKNRDRRQGPRTLTWAMGLSFVARDSRSTPILGVIDHGTRGLLTLRELHDRTSIGVVRILLDLIEKFGRPKFVRTDNEALFTSGLMSLALLVLGIRHQRIDPFCPWQNGRIERLFRTLKDRLRLWWSQAGVPHDLHGDLDTFRTWYNHARPHQSLRGLTPAMAWAGVTTSTKPPHFFSAWDGILTGFVGTS